MRLGPAESWFWTQAPARSLRPCAVSRSSRIPSRKLFDTSVATYKPHSTTFRGKLEKATQGWSKPRTSIVSAMVLVLRLQFTKGYK